MALTMINPAISWFLIVELPLICRLKTIAPIGKELSFDEEICDKTSDHIAQLVNENVVE
jgi:hypothetical protein